MTFEKAVGNKRIKAVKSMTAGKIVIFPIGDRGFAGYWVKNSDEENFIFIPFMYRDSSNATDWEIVNQ
jgi:hypothetical protein